MWKDARRFLWSACVKDPNAGQVPRLWCDYKAHSMSERRNETAAQSHFIKNASKDVRRCHRPSLIQLIFRLCARAIYTHNLVSSSTPSFPVSLSIPDQIILSHLYTFLLAYSTHFRWCSILHHIKKGRFVIKRKTGRRQLALP